MDMKRDVYTFVYKGAHFSLNTEDFIDLFYLPMNLHITPTVM